MRARIATILGLALAGLACSGPALAAPAAPVTWRSWDAGLKEAQERNRPILVDVYTDWCGWCKRMDRDVYALPQVRDYLSRRFVTVKLDAEANEPARYEDQSFTSRSLAARFEITGYPTTIFLRPNGEHLISAPGYIPPERFLLVLRYIGDGYLDRGVRWEDFKARAAR